eukprot:363353-Chlamydomonas_euryale.AAC.19
MQLLAHRVMGAASPVALYISNLPVGFPGVPIFFSRDAILAIDYPPVTEQVGHHGSSLMRAHSHDHICRHLQVAACCLRQPDVESYVQQLCNKCCMDSPA